ncbi:unnamed protein product, partial [Polarella glacialis]
VLASLLVGAGSQQSAALQPVFPDRRCAPLGLYFDALLQRCESCQSIDPLAKLSTASVASAAGSVVGSGSQDEMRGSAQCMCSLGLVQCPGGDTCLAS